MRLFLTLIPDPTSEGASPSDHPVAADPPTRVVLALPPTSSSSQPPSLPTSVTDLALLIASRFSLALHPSHPIPRLYLANDFVLPPQDPVADVLQAGDQVTVRYVPKPPGRRLPTPTQDPVSDPAATGSKKRKRSSYSLSSSSGSNSDSITSLPPTRQRGPSLKRRRQALDPLPSLPRGSAHAQDVSPSTAAGDPDPLLIHQIAETVTRRIAGLIESVLPTQEPMRARGSQSTSRRPTRMPRGFQLKSIEDDDSESGSASASTSASSQDSDYEALSMDEDESVTSSSEQTSDQEEDEDEDQDQRVDPFQSHDEDHDQGSGDVTPTGHGPPKRLVGTWIDSDSDADARDSESSDDQDDNDDDMESYLAQHAAKPSKRAMSSPSTMMGLFGPMGLASGPAQADDSSDDGIAQSLDKLLNRINVSVMSRGNSGTDGTSSSSSDNDAASDADSTSDDASTSSADSSSRASQDESSSDISSDSDQASEPGQVSSDSDSGPESAPIARQAKTAPPLRRSPSPSSPKSRTPALVPPPATRPGRIWASAVDLAQFPARRIAPSQARVQLAKEHNAALDGVAPPAEQDVNGHAPPPPPPAATKKTRRGKRGGVAVRAKSGAPVAAARAEPEEQPRAADGPVDYATCAKLTPDMCVGMPKGTRIAFKRMELSAQCTPEVGAYAEYEVVDGQGAAAGSLVVVPVAKPRELDKISVKSASAFGNGTGKVARGGAAGGWGPEVVLDDDDDAMDVDAWQDVDGEGQESAWTTKRKRPTGLAKFMLVDGGTEGAQDAGDGEVQGDFEPQVVDLGSVLEPVIVTWGSLSTCPANGTRSVRGIELP